MPEDRFQKRGYDVEFGKSLAAAFMDIKREGKIVASVNIHAMSAGENAPIQMEITLYSPDEFKREEIVIDTQFPDA